MLDWYRTQIREHGFLDGTRLFLRVRWSRAGVQAANRLLPEAISCPCCGWRGRRFYDYIEAGYTIRNAACPNCDSHSRHRAFRLWLNTKYRLDEKSGVAIVFAPERALETVWDEAEHLKVYRIDLAPARRVDLLADLQRLPVASDSVDLIWCHHVLEHVENDRAAIKELCRVLRPGSGEMVVSVPMRPGRETREYGFADPKESGHWRIYGNDFAERLSEGGFQVKPMDFDFSSKEQCQYGISAERFYICSKPQAQ